MARIRTIKPEFWTSEQVMDCSPMARLLFIGLWNFADDEGRMKFSPRTIKAQVFPGDDLSSDDVSRLVGELSSNGLVLIYTVDGKEYLQVTGWHHQKIDKPKHSKHPPPVVDPSPTPTRHVAVGREGKGEEGIVREGSRAERAARTRDELDDLETKLRRAASAENDPAPALLDLSPILGLLDAGYALEEDILPTIAAKVAKGSKPKSWAFFVDAIRDARARRLNIAAVTAPAAPPPRETDWPSWAQRWREHREWPMALGPEPGTAGCRCPADVLRAAGVDPGTGEVGPARSLSARRVQGVRQFPQSHARTGSAHGERPWTVNTE